VFITFDSVVSASSVDFFRATENFSVPAIYLLSVAPTPWGTGARAPPHFYKWLGTGAPWVEEQQTRNWPNCTKALTKTIYCNFRAKKVEGMTKNNFGAPIFRFVAAPLSTVSSFVDLAVVLVTLATIESYRLILWLIFVNENNTRLSWVGGTYDRSLRVIIAAITGGIRVLSALSQLPAQVTKHFDPDVSPSAVALRRLPDVRLSWPILPSLGSERCSTMST